MRHISPLTLQRTNYKKRTFIRFKRQAMPKLTKQQQSQRQNAILAAAERCFLRTGFHKTTMQDICKEASVSAGAIYIYFRSKEALIAGLAALEQERILERFNQLDNSGDFITGLEAMISSCISEQTPEKTSFLLEIVAESTRNSELRHIIQRNDEAIKLKMLSHFERARYAQNPLPHQVLQRLALLMPVIIDGLMLRKAMDPSFDQSHVAAELLEVMRNVQANVPAHAIFPAQASSPEASLVTTSVTEPSPTPVFSISVFS